MTNQQRLAAITARCEAATKHLAEHKAGGWEAHYSRDMSTALAEIDRLTEAQRWIPVSERLPEHRRSVLAYCPEPNNIYCGDYHGKEDDVFRDTGKWYYFGQGLMREIDEEVTHWQPLPAAPEKGDSREDG